MKLDDLQKAWQKQEDKMILIVDWGAVEKNAQERQRKFNRSIFWRDVREVGLCFLFGGLFLHKAMAANGNVHAWLFAAITVLVFSIALFMLLDRRHCKRSIAQFGDSVSEQMKCALYEVNHQIVLLRNVLWWYIAPFFMALVLWTIEMELLYAKDGWQHIVPKLIWPMSFFLVVFGGVYWLNQYAVRTDLLPRKEVLEAELESLNTAQDSDNE